jgi:hypothetical protein
VRQHSRFVIPQWASGGKIDATLAHHEIALSKYVRAAEPLPADQAS